VPDPSPYVRARIIGGLLLLSLVTVLGLIDAFSPTFQIDTVQFGLLLGTSLAMLGLDAVGRRLFP
jgi:hypothetical protein